MELLELESIEEINEDKRISFRKNYPNPSLETEHQLSIRGSNNETHPEIFYVTSSSE